MFEVNYLRGKYNKRSATPLMHFIVLKSGIKSCFDGFVFQDTVITLCCIFALHGVSLCFTSKRFFNFSRSESYLLKYKFFEKFLFPKI